VTGAFPCHPEVALPTAGARWRVCPACGTRVRRDAEEADHYGEDYPAARGHHDPAVGRCKVRTLERWLGAVGADAKGLAVCEVGFGGAACLAALQSRGAFAVGLEPIAANRSHAESLGIPRTCLFAADPLPELPRPIDLWLFQDSFEHVPDPNRLAAWVAHQSAPGARVLLVAPDAGSWSRRCLGPLWLHDLPDHRVHYSRGGVGAIFGRAGFRIAREFRPLKLVSLGMVWSHLRLLTGALAAERDGARDGPRVWFNVGEMGLWLERDDGRRQAAD